jgi:ADP-ribose pyrophosphatase
VPIADVPGQIASWRAEGFAIDVKLLLLLGGELSR